MRIRMRICYYLSTCFIIRFEGDIDDISCARSNVSCSLFSPAGRAAFMDGYPGYGATQHNQSFAARGEAAAAAGKCVQRLLMCLTFVVCAKRVEGTLRKCDVHTILHLTVCVRGGEGEHFQFSTHVNPSKSCKVDEFNQATLRFSLAKIFRIRPSTVGGQKGGRVPCLLGMSLNNRKLNLMSNVSFRQEETAIF